MISSRAGVLASPKGRVMLAASAIALVFAAGAMVGFGIDRRAPESADTGPAADLSSPPAETTEPAVPPTSRHGPVTPTSPDDAVTPVAEPSAGLEGELMATPGGFVEAFSDGEGWRDRFDTHVHFRRDHNTPPIPVDQTSWRADHDHDCGPADSERSAHAHDRDALFYACRDHMMTTMGDVDGYTTLAFAPKQTFPTVSRVCWDQNVTDLGGRQWTEVVITPANLVPNNYIAHVNPDRESVDNTATHHGQGTVGIKIQQSYDGFRAYVSRQNVATDFRPGFDAEGFESRSIRRQHCIVDNDNGTITMSVDRGADGLWTNTFPGTLPDNARVVFEDHNYTPDKDGEARSRYTWHWDNIIIDP